MDSDIVGIRKVRNVISQLCSTVNTLDKAVGGNGRKVREEDFLECLEGLSAAHSKLDVDTLRSKGCAVVVFSADELKGENAKAVEENLVSYGNEFMGKFS